MNFLAGLASYGSWAFTNDAQLLPEWKMAMPSSINVPDIPFCLPSFPASGSFPASWLFTSGSQSIGTSASATVCPMNIQGWFSLRLTGLISLQSKGLLRVFSIAIIQKHQLKNDECSLKVETNDDKLTHASIAPSLLWVSIFHFVFPLMI